VTPRQAATTKPELLTWPGTVMVSGRMLPFLGWAVSRAQRARGRDGLAPSNALDELLAAIHTAGAMSADGQADVREKADEEAGHRWVSTTEVAERLGCSTRHARRLAEQLGGVHRQGRWYVDDLALTEHEEGRQPWSRTSTS